MAKKKAESPVLFEKKAGSTSKPASAAKPAAKAKAATKSNTVKPKAVKSAKAGGGGAGEEAKAQAKSKTPAVKKTATSGTGRAFSTAEIGLVAGDVWRVLSEQGTKTAAELTKAVGAPAELVAAALGWLAREDKLAFETNGRSVTVSLL